MLPVELNFKIYFPDFFDLYEHEAKTILNCFYKVNEIIYEYQKIQKKIEDKKREIQLRKLNKRRR